MCGLWCPTRQHAHRLEVLVGCIARETINLASILGKQIKAIKSCLLKFCGAVIVCQLCIQAIAKGRLPLDFVNFLVI